MDLSLQQEFEKAVSDSKSLSETPSNDILLKLYAWFKQATAGDAPTTVDINPFDFIARAKHDAWANVRGSASADAMRSYIELIKSLK